MTTKIKLIAKQEAALDVLNDPTHDKILLVGGSGSGKSYVAFYKLVRACLKERAPCLVAREKLVDLTQGMIEQIVPAVLQAVAKANGVAQWEKWRVNGMPFAVWSDKRTKLTFCTGMYIRFAGLSKRDLSESGSDKILSPSWGHILVEESSEVEWDTIEMLLTRLRYQFDGKNKLILTENPPSMLHWSYRRFVEKKRIDGSSLTREELAAHFMIEMQPNDNRANLGEAYIRNLSQLTGTRYERFYLGKFQDTEQGEIFKRIQWTDNLPRPRDWEKLCIYTDPTPLTGKEHSVWADYKASVLVGLYEGKTFVLDIRVVRGSTLDMLSNIKQLWDTTPHKAITTVVMEKKQVPSDFNQVLQMFSGMTGWMCPLTWDTRHFGDKRASIETFLQPLFEHDMIFFCESWRNTQRGKHAQEQILRFSRKANKLLKDDVLDALMRADTWMKGKSKRTKAVRSSNLVGFVRPAYIIT